MKQHLHNKEQQQAISHESGPVMCLAGPGSGKTDVLTHHIRYLILEKHVDPFHILVLTFSKASAIEMQNRFLDLMEQEYCPVRFGTFHAVFFHILSRYEGYTASDILSISQKKNYLKTVLMQMEYQEKIDTDLLEKILSDISYLKNHNHNPVINETESNIPQFGEIYEKYENLVRQEHKLDFDDMMLLCQKLLENRTDILEEYRREIEYVLIDEYQDMNPVQYELVKNLVNPHRNLFAVGDDDQAIYGFRGSNPQIMLDFQKQFPNGRIITFPINYRCTGAIVEAANQVISGNLNRFQKDISANKKQGEPVYFKAFENKGEEYKYLVCELKRIYASASESLDDCACLFRTNMDASYLSELLLKEKIPYQMKERPYNPYDHFISRDFLHYLSLKEGELSLEEFIPVMNRPLRYISRDAVEISGFRNEFTKEKKVSIQKLKEFYRGKEYMQQNVRKLEYDLKRMKNMDIFSAVNYIRKGIGYDDFLRKKALEQNIPSEEYLNMADEIQRRMGMFEELEQLKNHINTYRESAEGPEGRRKEKQSGVHIMTFHASKGLEFDYVYLPDCNEGTIPYKKSITPEQIEEERRLFYVAMTRAKEKLHILYLGGDKNNRYRVSRFVTDAQTKRKETKRFPYISSKSALSSHSS